MAAAFAHRLVERIARRGAERLDVTLAEAADGFAGELEFRDRHEVERAQIVLRALRLGIEGADRLQRVAEEVEPHRIAHAGRIEIDDAAAHRVVARLAHRRGAVVAVELQPLHHAVHRQHVAGRGRERLRRDQSRGGTRWSAALTVVSTTPGRSRPLQAREPRQRGHALRHDAGMRRHAVVRQAIPGGKLVDLDLGREERERARKLRHARPVAADHHEAGRGRVRLRRDARARSATIRPSAPSATPESVSARPGTRSRRAIGGLRHQAAPRWKARIWRNSAVSNCCRRRGRAHHPGEQVRLRHVHQPLELVDLGLAQLAICASAKRPGDQVHLAHAAMPGAEQQAPPPLVQAFARNRAFRSCPPRFATRKARTCRARLI